MPPRASGMGERKKRPFVAHPLDEAALSSSAHHRQMYRPNRSPSPASAYFEFPSSGDDASTRLRPTPNAEAHFAYSTTLRRHPSEAAVLASPAYFAKAVNEEASTLWSKVVGLITGKHQDEYTRMENGATTPLSQEPPTSTASAQFAHTSIEVCFGIGIS